MEPFMSAIPVCGCPDPDALVAFDLGRLSELDLDAIAAHLSSCERCEGVLHDLQQQAPADLLVAWLKQCMNGPPLPDGPAFDALRARAEAVGVTLVSPSPSGWPTDQRPADDGEITRSTSLSSDDGSRPPGHGAVVARVIGQYEVFARIGQGGMGVVFRAQQVPLKRMVALKMVLAGHYAAAQTVARFVREGKAVARLRHPNVVQVYELGEHEGLPYFSMELVEGGSLHTRLAGGPLEPREAAGLVRTLALAVECAHQAGIIHRDLKPANILLARDGTPKITDFGLAKLLDADPAATVSEFATATDMVLGTPSYMAPEQAEGRASEIGPRTDVYALGAILYASLTGRPPFAGDSKVKVMQLVRTAPPVPPSRLRPGVPFWLEAVCLKCLEKSPARRYPTAQALADDLDRWLCDGRPRNTPGRLARLGRWAWRNAAVFLLGIALLSAGAASYWHHPDRVVREYQGELARGRAVTLIDKTGKPRWTRWQAGESRSQMVLDDEGTFTIHSWTVGLVELLPDPQSERYRITAQIRHEWSDLSGEVGLYFARKAYPGQPQPLHYFLQISFNAVRSHAEHQAFLPASIKIPPTLWDNNVELYPRLYSDEAISPHVDRGFSRTHGPRIKIGENQNRWQDLEVIVTPERVTARWNGQPFFTTVAELQRDTNAFMAAHPLKLADPLLRDLRPVFDARGGLGLFVWNGSASFRAVRVTPL